MREELQSLVPISLKAIGAYARRSLSLEGVEVHEYEVAMTEAERLASCQLLLFLESHSALVGMCAQSISRNMA